MALHVESETAVYAGRLQQVLSLFGSDDDAHSQSMLVHALSIFHGKEKSCRKQREGKSLS